MLAFGATSIPGRNDLAMRRIETLLVAPFKRNVAGDELAALEDEDLIGKHVNVENPAAFLRGNYLKTLGSYTWREPGTALATL